MTGREPIIERTTAGYFMRSGRVRTRGLYAHMFIDDVGLYVAPHRLNEQDDLEHNVQLSDDTRSNRVLVARIFSEGEIDRGYYEFGRSVCEFIRGAAQHLATKGRVYYEVGTLRDNQSLGDGDGIVKEHVSIPLPLFIPWRVFRLPGRLIQIMPQGSIQERRSIATVPLSRVMQIDLPPALTTRRALRRLHAQMREGENGIPSFIVQEGLTSRTDYDLARYYVEGDAIRQRALGNWGSPDRFLWSVATTHYYTIYRTLRFARAMALLREHILASMNAFLARMGFALSVRLPTAQTVAEIESALTKLERGEIRFEEARNLMH